MPKMYPSEDSGASAHLASRPGLVIAAEVFGLAGLWLLFSGKIDPLHLLYGAISIAFVIGLSRHLLIPDDETREESLLHRIAYLQAVIYPFWLLWEVAKANVAVARLILGPRRRIDPVLVDFHLPLDCDITKVTLGNSITLTPGTLTLRIDGDRFVVHAICEELAGGICDGSMARRAAAVFGHTLPDELKVHVRRYIEPRDRA